MVYVNYKRIYVIIYGVYKIILYNIIMRQEVSKNEGYKLYKKYKNKGNAKKN